MIKRVRAQGHALCEVVEHLSGDELNQPIPTLLRSADALLVDRPLSLRELLTGIAEDHLPRHAQQLLALTPVST